eukprot:6771218-Lingulodinium_polyedra.AAC.1
MPSTAWDSGPKQCTYGLDPGRPQRPPRTHLSLWPPCASSRPPSRVPSIWSVRASGTWSGS